MNFFRESYKPYLQELGILVKAFAEWSRQHDSKRITTNAYHTALLKMAEAQEAAVAATVGADEADKLMGAYDGATESLKVIYGAELERLGVQGGLQ